MLLQKQQPWYFLSYYDTLMAHNGACFRPWDGHHASPPEQHLGTFPGLEQCHAIGCWAGLVRSFTQGTGKLLKSLLQPLLFTNVTLWNLCEETVPKMVLTHWGQMTHICVSKLTIIGSDNGSSPGQCQAIIWTNAGILLTGPLGTNFSEILIEIYTFSFMKM